MMTPQVVGSSCITFNPSGMNTKQETRNCTQIEHKMTYFDVVRALHEALPISFRLLADDPNQLDAATRAIHKCGQRRALTRPLRRAGAGGRRPPDLLRTHPRLSSRQILEAVGGEPGEGKQAKTAMACGRRRENGRRRVWGGGGEARRVGSARADRTV